MGPVKAALEAACRYLAYELGPRDIRVHAISPGPLKTRAASGIKDFEMLLNEAASKAPLGELVDIMDVGWTCAYLATPLRAGSRAAQSMSTAAPTSSPDYRRLEHFQRENMTSIAVINAGSSSIKLAVYDRAMHPTLLLRPSQDYAANRRLVAKGEINGIVHQPTDDAFRRNEARRTLYRREIRRVLRRVNLCATPTVFTAFTMSPSETENSGGAFAGPPMLRSKARALGFHGSPSPFPRCST